MKIVDSLECPLCNSIPETFGHAFIECQKKHKLWRLVELWLGTCMVLKDDIKISDSERILGTTYKNPIIYTVILLIIKKKIYKHRQKGKVTNFAEIKYDYQCSYNMKSIMPELRGKLQYLNKNGQIKL